MDSAGPLLTEEPAYKALLQYFSSDGKKLSMAQMFQQDPGRFNKFRCVSHGWPSRFRKVILLLYSPCQHTPCILPYQYHHLLTRVASTGQFVASLCTGKEHGSTLVIRRDFWCHKSFPLVFYRYKLSFKLIWFTANDSLIDWRAVSWWFTGWLLQEHHQWWSDEVACWTGNLLWSIIFVDQFFWLASLQNSWKLQLYWHFLTDIGGMSKVVERQHR